MAGGSRLGPRLSCFLPGLGLLSLASGWILAVELLVLVTGNGCPSLRAEG